MTDKEIIIDGVDVSEWTDEEVRYKFEKHLPKAIRQIAFDLYKQLARKEQECEEINLINERLIAEKHSLNMEVFNFQNEQRELRKYIINICNLLGIDTRQSLLGANCLEFYAVLSSTAENKIKELR